MVGIFQKLWVGSIGYYSMHRVVEPASSLKILQPNHQRYTYRFHANYRWKRIFDDYLIYRKICYCMRLMLWMLIRLQVELLCMPLVPLPSMKMKLLWLMRFERGRMFELSPLA